MHQVLPLFCILINDSLHIEEILFHQHNENSTLNEKQFLLFAHSMKNKIMNNLLSAMISTNLFRFPSLLPLSAHQIKARYKLLGRSAINDRLCSSCANALDLSMGGTLFVCAHAKVPMYHRNGGELTCPNRPVIYLLG